MRPDTSTLAIGHGEQPWLDRHALRPRGLPQTVGACMSLRTGGTSPAPWQSFNLGDHVGDDPARVAHHRDVLARAVGHPLCFVNQVHGTGVVRWQPPGHAVQQADAMWSDAQGEACVIMVADCLPVLWWDQQGQVVAASHAGWRGLLGQGGVGVLEATHAQLQRRAPQSIWHAWLGPCIGPLAFEVGAEVRVAFKQDHPQWLAFFQPHPRHAGKWLADLPGMARARMKQLGVQQVGGNDGSAQWCTHSEARYFSHRRDGSPRGTGRMAAVIWRQA